jgi:hypothetical protein
MVLHKCIVPSGNANRAVAALILVRRLRHGGVSTLGVARVIQRVIAALCLRDYVRGGPDRRVHAATRWFAFAQRKSGLFANLIQDIFFGMKTVCKFIAVSLSMRKKWLF